jgi:hypothetical protein
VVGSVVRAWARPRRRWLLVLSCAPPLDRRALDWLALAGWLWLGRGGGGGGVTGKLPGRVILVWLCLYIHSGGGVEV